MYVIEDRSNSILGPLCIAMVISFIFYDTNSISKPYVWYQY